MQSCLLGHHDECTVCWLHTYVRPHITSVLQNITRSHLLLPLGSKEYLHEVLVTALTTVLVDADYVAPCACTHCLKDRRDMMGGLVTCNWWITHAHKHTTHMHARMCVYAVNAPWSGRPRWRLPSKCLPQMVGHHHRQWGWLEIAPSAHPRSAQPGESETDKTLTGQLDNELCIPRVSEVCQFKCFVWLSHTHLHLELSTVISHCIALIPYCTLPSLRDDSIGTVEC